MGHPDADQDLINTILSISATMIHYKYSFQSFLSRLLGASIVVFSLTQAQQPKAVAWPDVPKTGIGAGMTVCGITATDLTNYLNTLSARSETVGKWNVAGEFFIAPEFHLSRDISLKIEYAYLLNTHSITDPLSGGTIDFSYGVHMPSVIVQYMIIGEQGYFLKFGGGVGYYFASCEQKFPSFLGTMRSSAHGVGIKLDISGQTPLSDTVYLILGGCMRFSFVGNYRGGVFDEPSALNRSVSMNFISVGATMGLVYYF
jgi:hypothetical protein